MLYKGYVETKGKQSIEKLKNRTKYKTYEEVKDLNGFGGVLAGYWQMIPSLLILTMLNSLKS